VKAEIGVMAAERASFETVKPISHGLEGKGGCHSSLKEKSDKAMRRNDVKAIVVTGNGGKFLGGFDINVLQEVQQTGNLSHLGRISVDLMINTIEEAKKPSVAAIQGLALGGGLESAMSCHARISTPKAQLGFPELQFAIIPGFGGNDLFPALKNLK